MNKFRGILSTIWCFAQKSVAGKILLQIPNGIYSEHFQYFPKLLKRSPVEDFVISCYRINLTTCDHFQMLRVIMRDGAKVAEERIMCHWELATEK